MGIFEFLSTFKRACDAAGASHGQAFPLLSFRPSGAAKQSFVSAVSHSSTADRYAIRTYGDGVNWLLQKYATPNKLNEAYAEIISARQEQEEAPRSFGDRLERMCDRLDGLFSGDDTVDTFINGLHEAVKAHVLTFQMTKGHVSLPQAITTAQIYWTGLQKLKVDIRRHVRNTTTPIRVGTIPDASPAVVAAVTPPMPPRFARVESEVAAAPRGRFPSPRRQARAPRGAGGVARRRQGPPAGGRRGAAAATSLPRGAMLPPSAYAPRGVSLGPISLVLGTAGAPRGRAAACSSTAGRRQAGGVGAAGGCPRRAVALAL